MHPVPSAARVRMRALLGRWFGGCGGLKGHGQIASDGCAFAVVGEGLAHRPRMACCCTGAKARIDGDSIWELLPFSDDASTPVRHAVSGAAGGDSGLIHLARWFHAARMNANGSKIGSVMDDPT